MNERIPPGRWRNLEGLDDLVQALGSEWDQIRFVGGCVRDAHLGLEPSDIDCATVHPPADAMAMASRAGFAVVPTGIKHGTFTAVLPNGSHVEITTLRRDVETDGRHATVAFTDDYRADAARRDFTFNALYADPRTGGTNDYFGGLDDLRSGLVRFIGDGAERVAEDHLRIMRYYRFHGRFGCGSGHPESRRACRDAADSLALVSPERIWTELVKILSMPDPIPVLGMMSDDGILKRVGMPAADIGRLRTAAAREIAAGLDPSPLRRLAALLPRSPLEADAFASRMRMSNADRARLTIAADPAPSGGHRASAYLVGPISAVDRLILDDDVDPTRLREICMDVAEWSPPRLPIKGGELIAMGLPKGPLVSKVLAEIEGDWIAAGFPSYEETLVIARRRVDES